MYWVAYTLTASASAEGVENIYEAIPGRKMKLLTVHFVFPVGNGFNLELALMRGAARIAPHEGTVRGDGNTVTLTVNEVFESGQPVRLYYKNNDPDNPHSALVVLGFEVM